MGRRMEAGRDESNGNSSHKKKRLFSNDRSQGENLQERKGNEVGCNINAREIYEGGHKEIISMNQ
jgi:hypothetical protein